MEILTNAPPLPARILSRDLWRRNPAWREENSPHTFGGNPVANEPGCGSIQTRRTRSTAPESIVESISWRRGQSRANPSLAPIPCYTGKIQGILRFRSRFGSPETGRGQGSCGFGGPIPCGTEQGIFCAIQGNKTAHQGNCRPERGNGTSLEPPMVTIVSLQYAPAAGWRR